MQILQSGQFKVWFSLKEWLEIICIVHFLLLFVENMEQISSHSYGSSICCDIYVIPHFWVLYSQILCYADKVISIVIDIFKIFLLYKVYKKYNN